MPFQKGNKLGKGRPKGSPNLLAQQAKIRMSRVANEGLDHIKEDVNKIREKDPVEAAKIYLKLLEFIVPKQKAVEMRAEIDQRIQQVTVNINKDNGEVHSGNNS